METQYHHFGGSDSSTVHGERSIPTQAGLKRIVVYILYCILVLLMLILLLVTGIKLSQMNQEITDVKLHLKSMNNEGSASNSEQKAQRWEDVFLEELVPVRGACREGWASFQRSCYLFSTAAAAWNKAEELCRSHSGHLLVLNDVEELDYVSRLVEIRYKYWIGLVKRQHEGRWSWVDGTDFDSTPKFWDKGQHDDWDMRENGEDCGQLHGSVRRKRKLWNDADCSLEYRFICETKARETFCDNDASAEPKWKKTS